MAASESDPRTRTFTEVVQPAPIRSFSQTARAADGGNPEPPDLGPLQNLPGTWVGNGTGWNMIALPFHGAPPPPAGFKFRILMNQYDEELQFTFVDDDVPNRGLLRPGLSGTDQMVVTLDYQQKIKQIVAEDRPSSNGLAGQAGLPIHHEPGLWLFEKNRRTKEDQISGDVVSDFELDVARLASIPHGNSVLALGRSEIHEGMPPIPPVGGLVSGRFEDVLTPDYDFRDPTNPDPYFEPYRHYIDHPFMGNVTAAGFPGFSPADMNQILRFANQHVNIVRTTTLTVDTTVKSGGISNVPFSVREADPVSLKSTFWIQELAERDETGSPKLRLQYTQIVMLNFFSPREDGFPERASWPHISIATLEKVPAPVSLIPI